MLFPFIMKFLDCDFSFEKHLEEIEMFIIVFFFLFKKKKINTQVRANWERDEKKKITLLFQKKQIKGKSPCLIFLIEVSCWVMLIPMPETIIIFT